MYQIYQIQANDSLASIAGKFNSTMDEIRRLNGMGFNYMLSPGNYIVVPAGSDSTYTTYIVEQGDNLYSIAQRTGTDVQTLIVLNGLDEKDYIYPGQEILIPSGDTGVYVTEQDTLSGVAEKLGMSVMDLIDQNDTIYLLPEQIIVYKRTTTDNL